MGGGLELGKENANEAVQLVDLDFFLDPPRVRLESVKVAPGGDEQHLDDLLRARREHRFGVASAPLLLLAGVVVAAIAVRDGRETLVIRVGLGLFLGDSDPDLLRNDKLGQCLASKSASSEGEKLRKNVDLHYRHPSHGERA